MEALYVTVVWAPFFQFVRDAMVCADVEGARSSANARSSPESAMPYSSFPAVTVPSDTPFTSMALVRSAPSATMEVEYPLYAFVDVEMVCEAEATAVVERFPRAMEALEIEKENVGCSESS